MTASLTNARTVGNLVPEGIEGRGGAPHDPPTRLCQQFGCIIDPWYSPDSLRDAVDTILRLFYFLAVLYNCAKQSRMLRGASLALMRRVSHWDPSTTWISLAFGVCWL